MSYADNLAANLPPCPPPYQGRGGDAPPFAGEGMGERSSGTEGA